MYCVFSCIIRLKAAFYLCLIGEVWIDTHVGENRYVYMTLVKTTLFHFLFGEKMYPDTVMRILMNHKYRTLNHMC